MSISRRELYLDALGVTRWVVRDRSQPLGAQTRSSENTIAPEKNTTRIDTPEPTSSAPAMPSPIMAATPTVAAKVDEPVKKKVINITKIDAASDWVGLREQVKNCTACKLCETRSNTVFGVGPQNAPLMVIGEGPGADEDASGEPFVGRAGKLLDQMLGAIQHNRQQNTFIANIVKCRPPNNRDPEEDEAATCTAYLEQQIKLVKPKLLIAVGRVAAQRLLQTKTPLSKLRGELHHWGEDKTPLWITYHPAYLLRSPREKAKAWQDLKWVHQYLNSNS